MEISKPYFFFSSLSFRALKFLWEGMSFLGLIYMILHALFVTKNNFSLIFEGSSPSDVGEANGLRLVS